MRRRFFVLSALATAGFAAVSRCLAVADSRPAALGGHDDWSLSFSDSFDAPAEFAHNWQKLDIGGDNILTQRLAKNDVLADGSLHLQLGHNQTSSRVKLPFTGGYVQTRSFRQAYGYFECEMRIAAEEGVNNAFWLVSDPKTHGEYHFELDVAEVKYPDDIQGTARLWRPMRDVLSGKTSAPKLDEGFHRYGLLWGPETFRFYFDDSPYFTAPNRFAHSPAQMRFSNAVAGFAGINDGDVRGAATSIQQVRVFQRRAWALLSAS